MPDEFPRPPFHTPQQTPPGSSRRMNPEPDHGESSYKGSNKLLDKKALITGADSGIGRAVALAFAREGADVLVSYLSEDEDANETRRIAATWCGRPSMPSAASTSWSTTPRTR